MAGEPTPEHLLAMGELFPTAVHTLSQPASVLRGYLDLLAAGVDDADPRRAMERVRLAANRISEILALLRHAQTSEEAAVEVLQTLAGHKTTARVEDDPG